MSVKLPKETVKKYAQLILINIFSTMRKDKDFSNEQLADFILETLEKECHFDVVDDGE